MKLFELFGTIAIDDGGAVQKLNDVDGAGQKAESGFSKVAKGAAIVATAVTTAAVGLGKWSYDLGSSFQDKMAKASTLFGDVEVDTDNLQAKILELSGSTGIAADEIGEALYNALSAGVPVTEDMAEAMDFLTKSTHLSKAGFTDTDTAMSATLSVMNAYGKGVEDTDEIQKMLMQTQNGGIVTIGELGNVLSSVTPIASSMSVGFDQVSASMATMTAQKIPAAQAATGLKGLIAELGKSGTTAADNLMAASAGTKYAGMSFTDMMAAGVPLNEVLDMMGGYAENNGLAMMDMFGNVEAGTTALALSGKNSKKYTDSLAAMSTEVDVVGDAFNKVSETPTEKWNRAMAKMQAVGINLFAKLEPVIMKVMDIVIDNMPLIEGIIDQFAPIIVGLLETLLPMLSLVVEKVLPPMMELFNAILPLFATLLESLLPIGIELLNMLLPPILQIVEAIMPIFIELLNLLMPLIEPLLQILDPILKILMLFLDPLLQLIDLILPPLIELFVILTELTLKSLGDALSNVAKILSGAFKGAFDAITGIIDGVKKAFNGISDFVSGIFSTNWKDVWKGIKKTFSDVWESFTAIAKGPINGIIKLINGMITQINKFKISVPQWLTDLSGIKSFGFNISKLSYLKSGLDYVPYDNYPAMLHQGEKVLTKEEAKREQAGQTIVININGNSAQSGRELLELIETAVKQQRFAGGIPNAI